MINVFQQSLIAPSLINVCLLSCVPPKVGFKPAGGLRTALDAIQYMALVHNYLGPDWVQPDLLRFGASSLLSHIEARLYYLTYGQKPASGELDYL